MSLKRFVLTKRVGRDCENLKPDVQTAQHLFNEANLDKECGISYMPVTGTYGQNLERAIGIFQSMKVQGETRQNYGILAPNSATWGKLVECAKQTGDAAEYWNSLTSSQRERYTANMQRLKIEKENWVPFTHNLGLALQAFLNDHPMALGFLQKIVGSNETGITLVQLALDSIQLAAFANMVWRLGLGVQGIVMALKSIVGLGGEGLQYMQRVANAFSMGPLTNALKASKGVLGKLGIVVILIKAGTLFASGQWKLAFIEVVKGVVSLAVPIVGLIDAIFSIIDAILPSVKEWPVYKFIRALNPADLVGNALANVFAIVDLAWTAWGRNDYDLAQAILKLGPQMAKEIVMRSLKGLLDLLRLGWEAIAWMAQWFKDVAQKVLGYRAPSYGNAAVAAA